MLCLCMCHSQLPPVGGSALTRPVPFDGPPPSRGAGPWRCAGMAAGGVGPPPRGPLAGSVAGFDSAVPTALALPPWPALSVPWRASVLFPVPSVFRRPPCPTLIRAFVRSQSPPWRGCRRYRPFLPLPPRPARSVFRRALFRFRCRLFLPYRAHPPVQCFRSVSFRRPLAVEDSDHCAKQVRTMLGIVVRGRRRALCPGGTVDR